MLKNSEESLELVLCTNFKVRPVTDEHSLAPSERHTLPFCEVLT